MINIFVHLMQLLEFYNKLYLFTANGLWIICWYIIEPLKCESIKKIPPIGFMCYFLFMWLKNKQKIVLIHKGKDTLSKEKNSQKKYDMNDFIHNS